MQARVIICRLLVRTFHVWFLLSPVAYSTAFPDWTFNRESARASREEFSNRPRLVALNLHLSCFFQPRVDLIWSIRRRSRSASALRSWLVLLLPPLLLRKIIVKSLLQRHHATGEFPDGMDGGNYRTHSVKPRISNKRSAIRSDKDRGVW